MNLTNNDLVAIMLTTNVGLTNNELKLLTAIQWTKLGQQILSAGLKEPSSLLELSESELIYKLKLKEDAAKNIYNLLRRGAQLAIELEDLNKRGINFISRSNPLYPKILKHKLKDKSPAVLIYCGNLDLLKKNCIGVAGSRNIDEAMTTNAINVGKLATEQGFCICSGGAKGVDSISETAAFESGGGYVSFIADSLIGRIKKKDIRERVMSGRCLYITTDGADFPFTVWRAMGRNKYIYSMSKATVVINSDFEKGGTWEGAKENLKNNYSVPLVVDNGKKGNKELIKMGGLPVNVNSKLDFSKIIESNKEIKKEDDSEQEQLSIFS